MKCENCGEEIVKDSGFKTGYAHKIPCKGGVNMLKTNSKGCDNPLPKTDERIERDCTLKIYGAWAHKVTGKVDWSKPYPNPKNTQFIDMISGTFTKIEQVPLQRLMYWKELGATHVMLCEGKPKVRVTTIDEAIKEREEQLMGGKKPKEND